jgi:hypothetical protein
MLQNWCKIRNSDTASAEQIAKEIIWHNQHIKVDNKDIMYKKWVEKRIFFIHDRLCPECKILGKADLENKYRLIIPDMEYNSLISAIPRVWECTLK